MKSSKIMFWTGWVLSVLPMLMMIFGAFYGLSKPPQVIENFSKYGYSEKLLVPLCVVELVCAILYLIPQTAVLGAILLTGYLGGAVSTHLRAGESSYYFPIIFGVIIWLGLFLRDGRIRELAPIRRLP